MVSYKKTDYELPNMPIVYLTLIPLHMYSHILIQVSTIEVHT